jgi:hypothetical protein
MSHVRVQLSRQASNHSFRGRCKPVDHPQQFSWIHVKVPTQWIDLDLPPAKQGSNVPGEIRNFTLGHSGDYIRPKQKPYLCGGSLQCWLTVLMVPTRSRP